MAEGWCTLLELLLPTCHWLYFVKEEKHCIAGAICCCTWKFCLILHDCFFVLALKGNLWFQWQLESNSGQNWWQIVLAMRANCTLALVLITGIGIDQWDWYWSLGLLLRSVIGYWYQSFWYWDRSLGLGLVTGIGDWRTVDHYKFGELRICYIIVTISKLKAVFRSKKALFSSIFKALKNFQIFKTRLFRVLCDFSLKYEIKNLWTQNWQF